MGRPRKRQLEGHRNKNEKEARISDVEKETNFDVPSFLSDSAKQEFLRVADSLDCISDLDISVLAVYADAWDNYQKISRIIAETGPVLVKKRVTGKIDVSPNPAVNIQAEYVKRIMQCSLKLGLAVTDRMRLAVPKTEEVEDVFSEFEGVV